MTDGSPQHVDPRFVSFVVPTADDPPEVVQATVTSLLALELPAYEVVVVDGGTRDEALWRPVEQFCRTHGVEFRHVPTAVASRAAALRFAEGLRHPRADVVEVVEPGSTYEPPAPLPLAFSAPARSGPRRGAVGAAVAALVAVAVAGIAVAGDLVPNAEPTAVVAVEESATPTPSATPTFAAPLVPIWAGTPSASASGSASPTARAVTATPTVTAAASSPPPAPVTAPSSAPAPQPPPRSASPAPQPPRPSSSPQPPPSSPKPSSPKPSAEPTSPAPQPTSAAPSPSPSRKPGRKRG